MKSSIHQYLRAMLLLGAITLDAQAGVPLNNLEGVGGVAFNPLAYPAGQNKDTTAPASGVSSVLSKPQLGAWYVHLGDVKVDWVAGGAALSWFDRLETSVGREVIALSGSQTIYKNNFGAKLLLVKENSFDAPWLPAVSAGIVAKHTSTAVVPGAHKNGADYYLAATKLITQTPVPLLVSGGVISTKGYATGVLGYDSDHDEVFFGNADAVLLSQFAVGLEYREGAKFKNFRNANYWDAHAAWSASKQLTLVAAYVDAGNSKSTTTFGLGGGLVLSAQYAF
jgi:hypothetical protein